MNNDTNRIEVILDDIYRCCLENIQSLSVYGLLEGKLGVMIFLSYYRKYKNDPQVDATVDALWDSYLSGIPYESLGYNYADGFCGLFSTIEILRKDGIYEIDSKDAVDELSPYILTMMDKDISTGCFDLFYGLIGAGLFALKLSKPEILLPIVQMLQQQAIYDGDCIKWHSTIPYDSMETFNISMPHGMSSIVIVLSKAYGYSRSTHIRELITGAVNYMLKQELNTELYASMFPMTSIESQQEMYSSRLAWCYGDLCVALALWQAGKALNIEEWKSKAIQIFKHNVNRRSESDTLIRDGIICHGAAGVAQIYRRMFFETHIVEFEKAASYWTDQTINYSMFKDGFAGYKTARHATFFNSIAFLEGIAGIGLSLLASINPVSYSSWDQLLLIS